MRAIFGLLSLVSFAAVLLIALALVSNPPDKPLVPALTLAVFAGCAVLFRALRRRIA